MTGIRRFWGSLSFQVLMIALSSRGALVFVNWFGLQAMPRMPLYPDQLPDNFLPTIRWLDGFARWDAAWYVTVMNHGYDGPAGVPVQQRGFFPLYPMLSKFLLFLSRQGHVYADQVVAAIITANLCFLIAVVLFAQVVQRHYGADVARTASLLLCVSPLSFFFSAAYSESLFLLTALAAFWFAYEEQWELSALSIALCSATRMTGLAMIPAVMLIAWRSRASVRQLVVVPLVGVLGALSVMLYTWWRYDDFFAYTHAQAAFWANWQGRVGTYKDLLLRDPLGMVADSGHTIIAINLALALLWLVSLLWVWRHVEPGMALFTTVMVVFHIGYTWQSLGRYMLPAMAVYIVWAMLLCRPGWNSWVRESVIVASAIDMSLLFFLFGHGFWLV